MILSPLLGVEQGEEMVFLVEYNRTMKMQAGSHLWSHASWLDNGKASHTAKTVDWAHFAGS